MMTNRLFADAMLLVAVAVCCLRPGRCLSAGVPDGSEGTEVTALSELAPRPPMGFNTWEWFCLDNVLYHGKVVTVVWDKSGKKFGKGKGLTVLADGQVVTRRDSLRDE